MNYGDDNIDYSVVELENFPAKPCSKEDKNEGEQGDKVRRRMGDGGGNVEKSLCKNISFS